MHIMDNIELTDVERRLVNGMQMGYFYDGDPKFYPAMRRTCDIEGFPRGVKRETLAKLEQAGYLNSCGELGWMKAKNVVNDPPEDIMKGVYEALSNQFYCLDCHYYWRNGNTFNCVYTDEEARILFVTAIRSATGLKVILENVALDYAENSNNPWDNLKR